MHPELVAVHRLVMAIVVRIEPRELLVGHFAAAHPERFVNLDAAGRLFVGRAARIAHHELAGRDPD